jgi:hypothetical protein
MVFYKRKQAVNSHPNENLIHDDCRIEIEVVQKAFGMNDGMNVLVIDNSTDEVVLDEWEPDFEWAWETAKYYSKKYNLEIVDTVPY